MKCQIHLNSKDHKWKPLAFASQTLQTPSLSHAPSHKTLLSEQPLNSCRTTFSNISSWSHNKQKQTHKNELSSPVLFKQNKKTNITTTQSSKLKFKFADLDCGKRMCNNHQDKVAVYEITSSLGEMFSYCEKCTIMVASQGFQVRKLKQVEYSSCVSTKNSSAKEFEQNEAQLLTDLQDLEKDIGKNKTQTQDAIEWYESQYNLQLAKTNNYFSQIVSQLVSIKSEYQKQLLSQKQQLILNHNQWRQIFKDVLEQISDLKETLSKKIKDYGYLRARKQINQNIQQFKTINCSYKSEEELQGMEVGFVQIEDIKEILRELLSKDKMGEELKESVTLNNYLSLEKYLCRSIRSHERIRSSLVEESILLD